MPEIKAKKQWSSKGEYSEAGIYMLINAMFFFLNTVFIVESSNRYRLIVIREKRLIFDDYYDTIRGAKIAFHRMFKNDSFEKNPKPDWSHRYNPSKSWLNEQIEIVEKGINPSNHKRKSK